MHEVNLANYFLDFEANTKGDFYLVGYADANSFKQVILTPRLRGLASKLDADVTSPKAFAKFFLRSVRKHTGTIVAYSTAEQNYLETIFADEPMFLDGLLYCNLHKAAKAWIRKYKQKEFDELPPFRKSANDYFKKRQRRSLGSICRLISFDAPVDYAPGKTTARFDTVISALEKKNHNYRNLTATQKAKGTKAIKHNRYDVKAMIELYHAIQKTDPALIEKATSRLHHQNTKIKSISAKYEFEEKPVMNSENSTDTAFAMASKLYDLTIRSDELEKEIKDYRNRLSTAKLESVPSQVFDFAETGSVSIQELPPRFKKEYLDNNFQNIPSEELSSLIENNILEKNESFELNHDYVQQASDCDLKNLLRQGVLKKKTAYKPQLHLDNENQSDLQQHLMKMGKIEQSPHRITVRRQRPGRKSRRGRPKISP